MYQFQPLDVSPSASFESSGNDVQKQLGGKVNRKRITSAGLFSHDYSTKTDSDAHLKLTALFTFDMASRDSGNASRY